MDLIIYSTTIKYLVFRQETDNFLKRGSKCQQIVAIQLKKKVKIEIETLSNLMQLRAFISAKSKKKYLALRTKKKKEKRATDSIRKSKCHV